MKTDQGNSWKFQDSNLPKTDKKSAAFLRRPSGTSQRIKWIFGTSNALNFDLFSRNNSGEGIQSHLQLRIELIVQVNTIWTGYIFYI